ncbi:MAG: ammonia-forming cytochrome c nitrite reductase subunit c552, partial [Desulfuromonas sp.]
MNKTTIVIVVSVVATVLMLLLLGNIVGHKADQAMINVVPEIKKLEPRSAEWGKYYPRQYDSYMATKESDKIDDVLAKDPNLVVLWAGYGFSRDYNAPRG